MVTYMGEEMDRRDRGNRTVRYREAQRARGPLPERQSALWLVLDTLLAAAAVCGLVSMWSLARIFGVIS